MPGEELAIETDQVVGGYGKTLVLREASLRVPRGSIYGFLGPNGAGKTTAMRMALGLLRPIRGRVLLFGEPVETALPKALGRTGSLIEQPSLYGHLTGVENLEIARRLKGRARSDVGAAIEAMGIAEYAARKVREYSRGMRQRLGIAMAILGEPELLALDEPMNGLDAGGLQALRETLLRLHRERGTTVLLSSHQFDEVEQVATHIGILSGMGDLLFQGPRAQLAQRVPQSLKIRADRCADALCILEAAGYEAREERGELTTGGASSEMAQEVNRVLVAKGIGVHHLALDAATLEAAFLKVTKNVKPWEAL